MLGHRMVSPLEADSYCFALFNTMARTAFCLTTLLLSMLAPAVSGQDEAVIAVKARLEKSNSLHFNLGAATSLGQNNYQGGTFVGLGYQKRVNRILSVGGSLSYASYRSDYNDFMTGRYPDKNFEIELPNNTYYTPSQAQYLLVNLSGGDIRQLSLGFVAKINFVPIRSNTVASCYAVAAPSLVMSNLEQVESNINFFDHPTVDDYIQVNNESHTLAESQSSTTGGINLGAGVEFFPTNLFSFYIQAGLGYTFPVPFVDTSLYQNHILTVDFYNPFDTKTTPLPKNFPLSDDKGFTTLNFQLGLAYNF
jgi:opacity protein-like surface antigen